MEVSMTDLQQTILAKKAALAEAIAAPMARAAEQCAQIWNDPDALDQALLQCLDTVSNCQTVYAWDVDGIEISSLVQRDKIDTSWRGRDLSQRPYLKNHLPFKGIMLSSVYRSMSTERDCVTALQAVGNSRELMGFIAADFELGDIAEEAHPVPTAQCWQQFRGDPAVRGTVFMQSRVNSLLDEHIDAVLERIERLLREHGIFHCKIHFSSGRCSFWLLEDPYNYRIHGVDEIVDPELCLAYPEHSYPIDAKTSADKLSRVFHQFKALRFADETIYLRSASVNIMNGMIGLTFSCDGSHYMPVDEFLAKDMRFWLGTSAQASAA